MSKYVNVGCFVNGERPKSKKAIREALLADPASVEFDKTAVLFDGEGSFTGDSIPAGITLSVVGPDPYTKRNFYGSVVINPKTGLPKIT